MGQAKNRKMNDPDYGKSKKPSVRGLIINAPTQINGKDLSIDGAIDVQDLRFSLLFWDRLCWPAIPVDFTGESDEIVFLKDKAILHRPMYEKYGSINDILIQTQLEAFQDLNKSSPGGWAISQGANSLKIEDAGTETKCDTLISLLSAVPVPTQDVPLAEILEFKTKRRPELLAFRSHLDELIDEITGSTNQEEVFRERLKDMETTCADLRSVAKESLFPFYISNYSAVVNYDLEKAVSGAEKGLDFDTYLGGSGWAGLFIGAVASQIKPSEILKLRLSKAAPSPYKYAYQIQSEL